MIDVALLLFSFVLVLLCGFFVAAEYSFITVPRPKIYKLARGGDKKAISIKTAILRLSTQLSGAQLGITITSLTIGLLAEPTISHLINNIFTSVKINSLFTHIIASILSITIATIITMIFGELIPKNLAIIYPIQTAKFIVKVQIAFTYIMHYPILFINGLANSLLRLMGVKPKEHLDTARSLEELVSIVKHSAQKGTLPKNIAELIKSSLEFGQKHAEDVMTPRLKIVYLNQNQALSEIMDKAKQSGHSKFPVINKSIDNIVGTIQLKDIFSVKYEDRKTTKIKDLMQKALYIPSTIELSDLVKNLKGKATQLAIVIDEFGGTAGIVTAEDLAEELVGDVVDEHDKIDPVYQILNKGQWEISGLLRPDEVSKIINLTVPDNNNYETIGGLFIDRFGILPSKNDYINIESITKNGAKRNLRLTVTKIDGHRIDKLNLQIKNKSESK